jgi:hypothetical protein
MFGMKGKKEAEPTATREGARSDQRDPPKSLINPTDDAMPAEARHPTWMS